MEPASSCPVPPTASLGSVALVVVAALLLVGLSAWAFTEDTSPTSTEPGVRVRPGSAYNPVTAGEPLPDGFRLLLPRDGQVAHPL